ncbi:hypothetical protein [Paenibacillus lutrae]|uniref:Uncharacterized protein n=1 Tax=Paenibacillus lutrae TaxID=2078573 RepID=A0A7X3FLU5_9BACL|nr:hypothetical protein [Paenibacillus lutrae]MVP02025.1 hypothetical protein [Paenibacillus lutrae]
MMLLRVPMLFVMLLLVLSGCTDQEKKVIEPLLTIGDVEAGLEAEGLKIDPIQEPGNEIKLLGVDPLKFTALAGEADAASTGKISVYVFDSAENRSIGRKAFESYGQTAKFAYKPILFEHKNVFVIYWSPLDSSGTIPDLIGKALKKL